MAKDLVYYFTKDNYKKVELGEIQSDFNMSFVIDGTKDSAKIEVISFQKNEIEPYTIIWHENTSSWWIVSNDKVERYTNEDGFIYKHSLQLLGAIELLNARDLTDCGFYQNNYTIEQFILRLLKLSNLEYANDDRMSAFVVSVGNCIDLSQNIDYIKTFENYTLLSAINDIVDGYNCCAKLTFDTEIDNYKWGDNFEHICELNIYIISKTGNPNSVFDISTINEVKETKTIDKNSFGTTVISNVENVISSKNKTFPNVGTVKLTGTLYEILPNNAVIRLPSKIHKVNWIKLVSRATLRVEIYDVPYNFSLDITNEYSINACIDKIVEAIYLRAKNVGLSKTYDEIKELIYSSKDDIVDKIVRGFQITLYGGWSYDAIPDNGRLIAPTDNPNFYFPQIHRYFVDSNVNFNGSLLVADKETRDNIYTPSRCFYYERGDNKIHCASIFVNVGDNLNTCNINGFLNTDLRDNSYNTNSIYSYYINENGIYFGIVMYLVPINNVSLNVSNFTYIVNYVPMSDMKIKYDNSGERNDIQLFNQNGKLTDGVAFSKRLLSYSKEIESNNITKYGTFYNFNNIPKVGSITTIDNEKYIVNNVSIDFCQNENYTYYMSCEFTLSKEIAVKSLMVNPNTNIRDYGIPQNNNVQRKQLYRDFYELTHSTIRYDYPYMKLDKVLNLGNTYNEYQEHTGVIKLKFDQPYGGQSSAGASDTWYYQLDTTTYIMKKSIYEVINFNDNNIIGYGAQNVYSEFDITRIFRGNIDTKNTPISYVDEFGKVKDFYIAMTNINNLAEIYQNYKNASGYGTSSKSILNYSLFIPQEIYNGSSSGSSQLYTGVINTGTIDIQFGFGSIKITQYLGSFSGDYNDLSFDGLDVYDINGNLLTYQTDYYYGFTKIGNDYYLDFFMDPNNPQLQNVDIYAIITNINMAGYLGAKDLCDFEIVEENYNKDPLEVPVFEYSCQIDDSSDVIIGDNILDTYDSNSLYLYSFVLVPKNIVNNNNFSAYKVKPIYEEVNSEQTIYVNNGVEFEYNNFKLKLKFKNNITNNLDQNTFVSTGDYDIKAQKNLYDIMVVRHRYDNNFTYSEISGVNRVNSTDDLMFVIKNTNNATYIDKDKIELNINHYKLK